MKRTNASIMMSLAVLAVCLLGPVVLAAETYDLVPRNVLFGGGGGKFGFHVTSDGRFVTYFATTPQGKLGLYRQVVGEKESALVGEEAPFGAGMTWSPDDKRYFYLRNDSGDENFHLWMYDVEAKTAKDLTPFPGVKAQNLLISADRPGEVLVGLNRRDSRVFDMHRINLTNFEARLDTTNPGNVRWWAADRNLTVRAAVTCNAEDASVSLLVRDGAGVPWRTLINWPLGETGHLEGYGSEIVVGFSKDGRSLILDAAFEGDHTSLALVDIGTGKVQKIIAADPKADIWTITGPTLYDESQVLIHPETGEIQAAGFLVDIPEWKVIDRNLEADFQVLRSLGQGFFRFANRDKSDRYWIVVYEDDDRPGGVYLYDRRTKKTALLETTNTLLTKFKAASTKPVVFKARDGLEIHGYLTLPSGVTPKNLPTIMAIHGGPWSRDDWGYSPVLQWLANRGYAVFQVNYRGSTGFGKKYLNAGIGQWGVGSMQNDITDAVAWVVAQGIADPKRVAIYGYSYGGYASWCGVTFTPDLYACAVIGSGISNVKTFFETLPPWWGPIRTRWIRRIGVDLNNEATVRRISPFYHAAQIKAPVLIFHGMNDPRVKFAEAEQILKVLRDLKRDAQLIAFPEGGHGSWGGADAMEELGRTEAFFAKHLGGRLEPYAPVPGTTAQVR